MHGLSIEVRINPCLHLVAFKLQKKIKLLLMFNFFFLGDFNARKNTFIDRQTDKKTTIITDRK